MADTKLSDMTSASALDGTELLYAVQAGADRKSLLSVIKTFILSTLGTLATQNGTFSGTSSGTNTGDQTSVSGSSGSCTGNAATATALTGTLPVAGGGTGVTTRTAYAPICGGTNPTGAEQSIASVGTAGMLLTSNGAGALPTMQVPGRSPIPVITYSATPAYDASAGNPQEITLTGAATFSFVNDTDGQRFVLLAIQGGSGSNVITWPSGIKWSGGTPPMQSTAVGKIDVYSFMRLSSGNYLGFSALNF